MNSSRAFAGSFVQVDLVDTGGPRPAQVVRTKNGPYSVGFLLHDPIRNLVICVQQVRAAMISDENPNGEIVEAAAGRCDRPESVVATIVREASEELGATFREDQVELLNDGKPLALSPGILEERMYLAYVTLEPGQLERTERTFGLAEEGEATHRIYYSESELDHLIVEDMKTFALIQWFINHKL